jgi:hypothetical protein
LLPVATLSPNLEPCAFLLVTGPAVSASRHRMC